ncbi:hypothetical protein [Deinococcus alpinitundrae]|uniref:hypothetical protein n=1 Tax=Deinococcus alpinitundrae TaxID=468913 RepID=UPI00137A1989|nr:hypothetical protein [Deinococcus alpinitundrae]
MDVKARRLGAADGETSTRGLEFWDWGLVGGCTMTVATLPDDDMLQLTDGAVDLLSNAAWFWLRIVDSDGEEPLSVTG